ncbi:MAG: FtsW/RodA/SpoVE family cell cycle protein [Candidatus Nealsonbacteria bacterium]
MVLFSFLDYRIFKNDSYLILILYFFCCLALMGLFFFAPEIRGIKSWYKIGPISVDPIEFTKIILIILLAKYFSMRHVEMYRIRHIIFSGIYILLPSALIFFQPDLGSVLILVTLWILVLIVSGIKIKSFLALVLCGILLLALGWGTVLKDYQKERILNFIYPQEEPLGGGWSQTQSKIAIGSGGLFGQGFGSGSQSQYGFLPEPQTDFIFSAIAEEFGLFGIIFLLALFLIFILRIIKIIFNSEANFPRFFAFGFAVIIVFQIFINIGMNLGLLPIIGVPLPFVSYGGSGLISFFIGLGILQNIKVNQSS